MKAIAFRAFVEDLPPDCPLHLRSAPAPKPPSGRCRGVSGLGVSRGDARGPGGVAVDGCGAEVEVESMCRAASWPPPEPRARLFHGPEALKPIPVMDPQPDVTCRAAIRTLRSLAPATAKRSENRDPARPRDASRQLPRSGRNEARIGAPEQAGRDRVAIPGARTRRPSFRGLAKRGTRNDGGGGMAVERRIYLASITSSSVMRTGLSPRFSAPSPMPPV